MKAHRLLVLVGSVAMAGCGDENGDDAAAPGPAPVVIPTRESFTDHFAQGFPNDDWIVEQGSAAIDTTEGNSVPALAVTGDDTRVLSSFQFASDDPFTVSFQLQPVTGPSTARFEFRLERMGASDQDATFDLRLEDRQVRLEILEVGRDDVYPSSVEFHTVTFTLDSSRTATWSIDGTPLLSRAQFPDAGWRIELRSIDAEGAEFHVDNVELKR